MRKETYLFIGISIAVLIVSLVFVINYKIIIVSGESMRPEYNDGQIVLADKSFSKEDIMIGDIVVFKENGITCIKRVLAKEGDTIKQHDGKLYINDVIEAPYNTYVETEFTLEENEFFVCGDNYNNSIDSRTYGPIRFESVDGIICK